ncbi:kelch repeat-containing protein [Emticicia sp.]|uniref:Kelch repeat-containing protein n=1 Tax=Emticicia sp. TaxID=1930953 RepID=UPI003751F6D7
MKISIKLYFTFFAGTILLACSKTDTPAPTTTTPIVTPTPTPTIKAFMPDGRKALEKFMGAERSNAVSFAIGDKLYVGSGYASFQGFSNVSKDFYEYDPATNKWKAIAEFPGSSRANAIVFVIGGKAYVGLGTNYDRLTRGDLYKDFYEYDPATNKWTKKEDFTGTLRDQPIYFTIGDKGYFGTGNIDPFSPINTNEFWEYDAKTDKWTKKASFGGAARCRAFAFAIGGKGYVGGGEDNFLKKLEDFYEYDPTADKWARKGDFNKGLSRAVGFSIGDFGYVSGGITGLNMGGSNDYYKYDSKIDNWTLAGEMAAVDDTKKGRFYASCIPYKGKAYIGLGSRFIEGNNLSDFYEVVVK